MASPQCSSSMARPSGSNRLLQTLIVFSLMVHAGIFIHISGIYRSRALSYIEMTLQNIARPVPRDIPAPAEAQEVPAPADAVKRLDVVQRHPARFRPLAVAPVDARLSDSLIESIRSSRKCPRHRASTARTGSRPADPGDGR